MQSIKLDGAAASTMLMYISSSQFLESNRQMAAIQLKNIIKKVYGSHSYTHYDEKQKQEQDEQLAQDDPANLIDEQAKQVLMA